MKASSLKGLRSDLTKFLKRFDNCIKTRPSRKHLQTYISGQLGDLKRKSIEPMALEAGVAPRTLQEFLSLHQWDENKMAKRVRQIVARDHKSSEVIGVIDETSFFKKGMETAGVSRQWCGSRGKVDNCVVTVNLGYATDNFHCLVDNDLFIPEGWFEKGADRCGKVGIPEALEFRTKPQIALDLLKRCQEDGISPDWITADELYGRSWTFRDGLKKMGLSFVVEIPCDTQGWTESLLRCGEKSRRADRLWKRGGPTWDLFHVKETEKGPEIWEARVVSFYPWKQGEPGDQHRLIVVRHCLTGEIKYLLSKASENISSETLIRIAFSRWHIERIYEDSKGEIGLGHFEVRNYKSLMRHLTLSMVSFLFLNRMTSKFSGEKKFDNPTDQKSCRHTVDPRSLSIRAT